MKKCLSLAVALMLIACVLLVSCSDPNTQEGTETQNETKMPSEELDSVREGTETQDEIKMPSEGLDFILNEDGTCFVNGIGQCHDYDIVIPSTAPNGAKVVGIGEKCFGTYAYGTTGANKTIRSIIIPKGVTYIGNKAFKNCQALETVVLPEGLESIGEEAFMNCYSLSEINMPLSITSIAWNAFHGEFYDIPVIETEYGVDYIDTRLIGCDSKVSIIEIREGTLTIESVAFFADKITIPASVKKIVLLEYFPPTDKDIVFKGTKAQWGKIEFIGGKLPATVHCTDGDIAKADS